MNSPLLTGSISYANCFPFLHSSMISLLNHDISHVNAVRMFCTVPNFSVMHSNMKNWHDDTGYYALYLFVVDFSRHVFSIPNFCIIHSNIDWYAKAGFAFVIRNSLLGFCLVALARFQTTFVQFHFCVVYFNLNDWHEKAGFAFSPERVFQGFCLAELANYCHGGLNLCASCSLKVATKIIFVYIWSTDILIHYIL